MDISIVTLEIIGHFYYRKVHHFFINYPTKINITGGQHMLGWNEIETRAVTFQKTWRNCTGDERQEAQTFEKDFMNVFGVDWHDGLHEHQIMLLDGSIGYIDYFLPGKILVEMKSKGKSLATAYTQAMSYVHALKPDEIPVLVVVCDFNKMNVYNLKKDHPYKPFKLNQLKSRVRIFGILAGYGVDSEEKTEIELNTDASYKMAKLHDALKENGYEGHALEVYLVRLLFCLFADDTGIFEKGTFEKYLKNSKQDGSDLSMRIMMLFSILDTLPEIRMKNLSEELKRFRYINGGLFKEQLPPAFFSSKMRSILLECCAFDWTQITPAIFGAMFQGVMNPQERREMGAHYTSEENIMKVIGPLFLDDLYDEFERSKNTTAELTNFHDKISSLTFLDPACGCGNFLIVTYQRLRELEFEILKLLYDNAQIELVDRYTKVSLHQFYGIEYEEFPCEIAKVSLILMKHLIDQEISNYFGMNLIDFPIRDNGNIYNGNALRIDWNSVVPNNKLNYIIGNPPFIGQAMRSIEQTNDMKIVFEPLTIGGKLDYVSAWFKKASDMMKGTNIRTAFVSSNSICQGESVNLIWEQLLNDGVSIDFAYTTFNWTNNARGKAAVMCVIVSFSRCFHGNKKIFGEEGCKIVSHINGYLKAAPDVFIKNRNKSINKGIAKVVQGSPPADDGRLMLTKSEKDYFIGKYPETESIIKPFIGSKEFINDTEFSRYCFWLVDSSPAKFKHIKELTERFAYISEYRAKSSVDRIQKTSDTPYLFTQNRQPKSNYLFIPRVSSSTRKYIPVGFLPEDVIASDAAVLVYDATLYEFGLISSKVHNAWMSTVAGRLKNDYRYAPSVFYNFPLPNIDERQRKKIEECSRAVLYARSLYPNNSLADMYGADMYLFPELLKAHKNLDKEVFIAYGCDINLREDECVSELMKLYQQKVEEQAK